MGIVDRVIAAALDLGLTPTRLTADNLVTNVLKWVSGIAGIIAFMFLIYGGFLYLTAAGNPESSKKGGQTIINAIIGLVIIA
ncbi:MAG TPA: hypothetical protein VJK08_00705, partial [Patescibacteria group bacterium]|nr:hypothetical protein [Patescibacteria group bacterium]